MSKCLGWEGGRPRQVLLPLHLIAPGKGDASRPLPVLTQLSLSPRTPSDGGLHGGPAEPCATGWPSGAGGGACWLAGVNVDSPHLTERKHV